MTMILAIDPGAKTGWVTYHVEDERVVDCGTFETCCIDEIPDDAVESADVVVIERIVAHGPTLPAVVEAAYVCGRIVGEIPRSVFEFKRHEIRKTLTDATYGEVRVKNDATAWAALVLLHGEGSDAKPRTRKGVEVDPGGSIGRVRSHERAALAAAVAYVYRTRGRA